MVRLASVFVWLWTVATASLTYASIEGEPQDRLPKGEAKTPAAVPISGLRGSDVVHSNEAVAEEDATDRSSVLDRQLAGYLPDGTRCLLGTTCNNCYNPATWWWTKFFTACGTQGQCLEAGTACNFEGTCSNCCNFFPIINPNSASGISCT